MIMKYWVIALVLQLFGALVCQAQITEEGATEVDLLLRRADELQKSRPYRATMITEDFDGDIVERAYTKIEEFVPPDRVRTFYKKVEGTVTQESETIRVGDKVYLRQPGEVWQVITPREPRGGGGMIGDGGGRAFKLVPKTKTVVIRRLNEKLNDNITDYYEVTKETRFERIGLKRLSVSKYWFKKDGTLARTEATGSTKGARKHGRRVITYEYDIKINIEAPIK